MAKKSKGPVAAPAPSGGGVERVNIGIEKADNGHIVHLSTERGGNDYSYESKKMVAPDHKAAMKIAVAHIGTMAQKLKKKSQKKGISKTLTKR